MLFRLLLIALLVYLAVKVWRLLTALFGAGQPSVKGPRQRSNPPLDLEGKDVEDAKFREIDEKPPSHQEDRR